MRMKSPNITEMIQVEVHDTQYMHMIHNLLGNCMYQSSENLTNAAQDSLARTWGQ